MNSTTLRLMLYTITTTRMKIIIDLSSWICYSTDRLDISCQAPQGKVSFSFVFFGLARNLDQSLRHRCCISILNYFLLLWLWIGWINTYLKYLIYRSTASIRDCVIYTQFVRHFDSLNTFQSQIHWPCLYQYGTSLSRITIRPHPSCLPHWIQSTKISMVFFNNQN